ncbi:hypothetical protein GCM10017674_66780 [Streptomyces gardneri]|uniref:Uncharacterized protein n=1 Tax=Streptomyces gardneri TaxID=66892 RepID=A0A4Y3RJH6_9ACTN|nr:hypothetical protein SGA01_26830 [Streptomyces gardneri]GHH16650.1 hypothetical protein GCM10017674_66780 [Streptomyces gardneri]
MEYRQFFGHGVIAGGHEGAVHDEYGALGKPPLRLEREHRPRWSMMRPAADPGRAGASPVRAGSHDDNDCRVEPSGVVDRQDDHL